MTPLDRLELSERMIVLWEGKEQPGGPISDNLRMIVQELIKLLQLAPEPPNLADRIDIIAYRYRLMEIKVKQSLN